MRHLDVDLHKVEQIALHVIERQSTDTQELWNAFERGETNVVIDTDEPEFFFVMLRGTTIARVHYTQIVKR